MSNSSQPKSWRDVLPIHPAAELFPSMSESELRELAEDIKKNGLQNCVTLCKYKNKLAVLDGRNRLDAMELAGIKTGGDDAEIFRPCKTDPYEYVLSANIHRRHLTAEQKREIIEKLLKAKPEASDRQIAKQTKTSPTWVGKIRKKAEAAGDVSTVDTRIDTRGRKQPSAKPKKSANPTSPEAAPELTADEIERAAEVLGVHRSVDAKDVALSDFTNRVLELARLTSGQEPARFKKTPVSFSDLNKVGEFLTKLANLKSRSAEVSAEQRTAEYAVLDEVLAP